MKTRTKHKKKKLENEHYWQSIDFWLYPNFTSNKIENQSLHEISFLWKIGRDGKPKYVQSHKKVHMMEITAKQIKQNKQTPHEQF